MSKKVRKAVVRKPIPAVRRPTRPAVDLPPEQRHVVDIARDLPQITDPLDAEMITGAALTEAALWNSSTPYGPRLPAMSLLSPKGPDESSLTFAGKGEQELWTALIGSAVAVSSRRSLALLRGMAAVLPDHDVASNATAEADKLAAAGIAEPDWAKQVNDLVPGECWIFDDKDDSGYVIATGEYSYAGREHAISVFINHLSGGCATNVTASFRTREMRSRMPLAVTVSSAEAHELIQTAYEQTYQNPFISVDPDVHRLRLLLLRRIRQAI